MLPVNTHVTPPPALGDEEGKVSSLICRSYSHLCSAPLETCFIFSEKKKVNVKAVSSQNNFANVCPLLPFKPIKYLSLTILSIQI